MRFGRLIILAVGVVTGCGVAKAQAPAGATGECKDGTYSTAKSKSGACSGHKGVQTWYAANTTPATPRSDINSPATSSSPEAPMQPATGGGPGQVWVNTSTKVYHCSGDRYYGKTKSGAYMSESDAIAKGARPDAGKPCHK